LKHKLLFIVSAVFEAGAGLALLVSPALAVPLLLGASFDTPADSVVGRVCGAALLALGLSCWRASQDEHSRTANGIASAMLLYNVVAVLVLAYAGIGWRLSSIFLWPVVALHLAMAVWCLACLLTRQTFIRYGNPAPSRK